MKSQEDTELNGIQQYESIRKKRKEPALSGSDKINKLVKKRDENNVKIENIKISNLSRKINESFSLSINFIRKSKDETELLDNFLKSLNRLLKLKKIAEEKLLIDKKNPNSSNILTELGVSISNFIVETFNIRNIPIEKFFIQMCDELSKQEDSTEDEEEYINDLSYKKELIKSSMECFSLVSKYNLIKDVDQEFLTKTFVKIIKESSNELAKGWNNDISDDDKKVLSITLIPVITNFLKDQWEIFILNNIICDQSSYMSNKQEKQDELYKFIIDEGINEKIASKLSKDIVKLLVDITEEKTKDHNHLTGAIFNKIKKTYFFNFIEMAKTIIQNEIKIDKNNFNKNAIQSIESKAIDDNNVLNISIVKFKEFYEKNLKVMLSVTMAILKKG